MDPTAVRVHGLLGVCPVCQQGRISVKVQGKQEVVLYDHDFRGWHCEGSGQTPETTYPADAG